MFLINNTTRSDELSTRTEAQNVVLAVFIALIMFFAIFGNLAVIFAIGINKALREENSNRLIVNLAVTDLSNGFIVMFSSFFSVVTDSWKFGNVYCDFICALNYCLIIASMLTLCFISCDRYQAIIYPLRYVSKVTPFHLNIAIAYSWIQGLAFSLVPVFLRWVEYDYWEAICAIQWHRERPESIYYVVTAFLLCFLLPGVIMAVNYYKIIKQVGEKVQTQATSNTVPKSSYSTSSKAIRSLLVVVVAYFVCMTPFSVTKLIKVTVLDVNILNSHVNTAASVIAFISSAINPLIYGIFRKDFQKAYRRLFYKVILRESSVLEELSQR